MHKIGRKINGFIYLLLITVAIKDILRELITVGTVVIYLPSV